MRLVSLDQLEPRDITAWRELAERAVEPNPFWDPDFVLPAARGLGASRAVGLLHSSDDQGWTTCLPVHRRSHWHRLPLPCVTSWRHRYCLLGTPLVAPDGPTRDRSVLIESMAKETGGVGFAGLEWVGSDGPVANGIRAEPIPRSLDFERFSRATLKRRPQPDYLSAVKGKHRREFRRLAQALEQELGGALELVDRAGQADAVDAFLKLEASGWKGREGTAMACDPGHARFFREMTRGFSARGALELLFLEAGGRTVAARCSILAGRGSFCFKVAYDERFKRFSPGRELELRQVDRFHRSELAWMDSCAQPDNELYNRLWPDRRELVTTAYPAPGVGGAIAASGLRLAATLRERGRRSSTQQRNGRAGSELQAASGG